MFFDVKPFMYMFWLLFAAAVIFWFLIPSNSTRAELVYKDANKTIYCPKGFQLRNGKICVKKVKAVIKYNKQL